MYVHHKNSMIKVCYLTYVHHKYCKIKLCYHTYVDQKICSIISYLRVYPWALRLYHPEAFLYSLSCSRRLYSGAEGWYNLNAHG
jgi:hypothetical protein